MVPRSVRNSQRRRFVFFKFYELDRAIFRKINERTVMGILARIRQRSPTARAGVLANVAARSVPVPTIASIGQRDEGGDTKRLDCCEKTTC